MLRVLIRIASTRILMSTHNIGERAGSVVECRTPEREVQGSRPTAAVCCPWARHFTPRKYWLITQEAMAPSRHDWKIVDWDVKPQHNQPTNPQHMFLWRNKQNYPLIITKYTCTHLICSTDKVMHLKGADKMATVYTLTWSDYLTVCTKT